MKGKRKAGKQVQQRPLRMYYDVDDEEPGTPWTDRPCVDGRISDSPSHEPLDVLVSNDEYEDRKCIKCGLTVRADDYGLMFVGYTQGDSGYWSTLKELREHIEMRNKVSEIRSRGE